MSSTVPIRRAWLGSWHLTIGEKNSPLNLIFGYFEEKNMMVIFLFLQ
jgi:hypothetical protein